MGISPDNSLDGSPLSPGTVHHVCWCYTITVPVVTVTTV